MPNAKYLPAYSCAETYSEIGILRARMLWMVQDEPVVNTLVSISQFRSVVASIRSEFISADGFSESWRYARCPDKIMNRSRRGKLDLGGGGLRISRAAHERINLLMGYYQKRDSICLHPHRAHPCANPTQRSRIHFVSKLRRPRSSTGNPNIPTPIRPAKNWAFQQEVWQVSVCTSSMC